MPDPAQPAPPAPSAFRLLLTYLLGSRDAILRIAASRSATLASLVLVLSAGFAREYDGENLIAEPWHALRPLAASTVTGTVLFLLIHTVTGAWRWPAGYGPRSAEAYRRFMTCYWMTAPLAWLYAIPFERFMDPIDAIHANLWLLALVAGWRVALITRVITVLYGTRPLPTTLIVLLFGNAVAVAAVIIAPTPVIDVMGGLRHNARDQLVLNITTSIIFFSVATIPALLIASAVTCSGLMPSPPELTSPNPATRWRYLVLASLAVWIVPLALAQPEQINRHHAERLLTAGRIDEAIAQMTARGQSAYPPHWDPPPHTSYRDPTPDLNAVIHAIRTAPTEVPAWITAPYADKLRIAVLRDLTYFARTWAYAREILIDRNPRRIIDDVEHGSITAAHLDQLAFVQAHDPTLTPEDHAAIDAIAAAIREALAAQAPDDPAPPPP